MSSNVGERLKRSVTHSSDGYLNIWDCFKVGQNVPKSGGLLLCFR